MMYAFLAAFLVGLGAGWGVTHQFDKAEILQLQTAIVQGNMQAEQELQTAKTKVAEADIQAEQLNNQIEVSHAQAVETANALTDRVTTAGRLYASRQNCGNPLSSGPGSPVTPSTAPSADFPGGLAEIVRRADDAAIYAQSCWQFVSANCGIANAK